MWPHATNTKIPKVLSYLTNNDSSVPKKPSALKTPCYATQALDTHPKRRHGAVELERYDMQRPDLESRIDDLKRKLRARDEKPGFRSNSAALKAEIARLEAMQVEPPPPEAA